MSTETTNYKLVKPALSDVADITAMNPNWDTIDRELLDLSNQIKSLPSDVTPQSIGAVKLYKDLSELGLTTGTATTNAIIQAMVSNSMAMLEVNTDWTAATEIPDKYTTMVIFKRFNGRTSGILTSVASQNIWFGSQHSGGSFAGWKAFYGEHNITKSTTDLTEGTSTLATGHIYLVYE